MRRPRARRALRLVAALLATVAALTGPTRPAAAADAVTGCPSPDPAAIVVDPDHSKGGAGPTCNYSVKDGDRVVGGFAVVVEFGCPAEVTSLWAGKARKNAVVSDTEIVRTEAKGPGNYETFTGRWSTQEKVFLRVGATAIATITAYSDTKIYAAKKLGSVALAVTGANRAAAPACAQSGIPATGSSEPGAKKLAVSFGRAPQTALQDALDILVMRAFVTSGGKPVDGVAVDMLDGAGLVAQGTTDAQGEVTLDYKVPKPLGRTKIALNVRAAKAGYEVARATFADTITFNVLNTYLDVDPIVGKKRADEPVTVTGRVYSAVGGFPLPRGVPSTLDVDGYGGSTDADGRFAVQILARKGTLTVKASPKDLDRYAGTSRDVAIDVADPSKLVMSVATDRDWYPADGTIVVKGTLSVDGKPASGFVGLSYAGGNGNVQLPGTQTAAGGSFEFVLPKLSSIPGATTSGAVFIALQARVPGATEARSTLKARVRGLVEGCEPLSGFVASGIATFPLAETVGDTSLFTPDRGGRGRGFSDGRFIVAESGKVALGFPLDADGVSTAGITLPAGARIEVVRYCRDENGRVTLAVRVLDNSAVRVGYSGPSSNDPKWRVLIQTDHGTVTNVKTDYAVAVQGDTTTVSLHEGAVLLQPKSGTATPMEAPRIAFMKKGSVRVEDLPGGFVAGIDDPGPLVAGARPGGATSPPTEPAAAERFTIQAGIRRVRPGETVDVPIYLVKAERVANINVDVGFDAAVVAVDGGDKPVRGGSFLQGALLAANTGAAGVVKVGLATTTGQTGAGSIAWIRFRAKGSPGDVTPVRLDVGTVNDEAGTRLEVVRIEGRVEIIRPEDVPQGDCDGNGRLDEADALCALQMSVRLRPEDRVLDVDGAAGVTSRDAAVILQRALGKRG
jgi:hypothetical protein